MSTEVPSAETAMRMERFAPTHGWANRLLHIDLSERRADVRPLDAYVPEYLGGRGVAARLAWEMCPEPVAPWAPESPLLIVTGALTGTRSPYSGRTAVCGFSPQAYPFPWFTRANIGHHWGTQLKHAGYDGVVITGASDEPVRVLIHDDEVRILPAADLWGLDTYDAQDAIRDATHASVRTLTIGPAGERLSRIATIHTATSSTAGQGGFGAVMGAKKLKAISVLGSGRPSVAHPEKFNDLVRKVGAEIRTYRGVRDLSEMNRRLQEECGGRVRPYACTAACPTPCNLYYSNMPGVAFPERVWEGHWTCVGSLFRGVGEQGGVYDWRLGSAGGLEMNVLSNRYGLNQWEIIIGMVPWLERCQREGLLTEFNGRPIDWQSADFWASFLHAIAYREGLGDVLAEGGPRAARSLGLGGELLERSYTGWGYAGHWDGHACQANRLVFPFWIVSALQWMTDTRDPYSSSHGYVQNVMLWGEFGAARHPANHDDHLTWEQMRAVSAKVYGTAAALDPLGGYEGKAIAAHYHDLRSVMKDSLPTDDQVFPLIYSVTSEDRFFRVKDVLGLGDVEGPSVDYQLFRLGTGTEWAEAEFDRAAERIYTLERALNVRHWGRTRRMDETVLPRFEYEENWENPLLGRKYALEREAFRPVAGEYYRLLGWDEQTGRPSRTRLVALGLQGVYEAMTEGEGRRMKEKRAELDC